jgi:quinol monooxygenase YgiN
MVSRIVSCTIDPGKVNEFKAALNEHFLPRIQAQPGFVENIESLDPTTGQFSCLTLWKSKEDVERYDQGLFREVAESLKPLLHSQPTVQTLPLENSSVHKVRAGKAAA